MMNNELHSSAVCIYYQTMTEICLFFYNTANTFQMEILRCVVFKIQSFCLPSFWILLKSAGDHECLHQNFTVSFITVIEKSR